MANARLMETLTDPRLEPHLYLALQLALLAVVALVLFLVFPSL
ncbi:MAG: hypothetical protein ACYDCK_00810 [Thermoplasmatota archaeon]